MKDKLTEKLDQVFSRFIRLRDAREDGTFQCISCGRILPLEKAQCGHYFSRAKMSTRWDEENCSAECCACNLFRSDHLDGYHKNLVKKIGQQAFDLLTLRAHSTKKWSSFEKTALINHYKVEVEKLKKEKGL